MSPLVAAHSIIGTVCLTVGLMHLLVGLRKEDGKGDLLFAAMVIGIACGTSPASA